MRGTPEERFQQRLSRQRSSPIPSKNLMFFRNVGPDTIQRIRMACADRKMSVDKLLLYLASHHKSLP